MNKRTALQRSQKGFTLIELLITIGIITTLAVAVFVALNPSKRLEDARNARRSTDVDTTLTAIHAYNIDSKGTALTNMPAANTEAQLGTAVSGCAIATGGCNVTQVACVDLLAGAANLSKYLKSMPIDPIGSPTYDTTKTGYSVVVDSNGLYTIRACASEGTANISASR